MQVERPSWLIRGSNNSDQYKLDDLYLKWRWECAPNASLRVFGRKLDSTAGVYLRESQISWNQEIYFYDFIKKHNVFDDSIKIYHFLLRRVCPFLSITVLLFFFRLQQNKDRRFVRSCAFWTEVVLFELFTVPWFCSPVLTSAINEKDASKRRTVKLKRRGRPVRRALIKSTLLSLNAFASTLHSTESGVPTFYAPFHVMNYGEGIDVSSTNDTFAWQNAYGIHELLRQLIR